MSRYGSDQRTAFVGIIVIAALCVSAAAAFNLQKFPGFRGHTYHAEFADASGLHVGGRVEIAGVRVGRVSAIKIDGTKIVAVRPNGTVEPLLWLYEYDERHRHVFLLRKPLTLEAGTIIRGVKPSESILLLPTASSGTH